MPLRVNSRVMPQAQVSVKYIPSDHAYETRMFWKGEMKLVTWNPRMAGVWRDVCNWFNSVRTD